jgi:hypothetical protein
MEWWTVVTLSCPLTLAWLIADRLHKVARATGRM